MCVVSNFLFRTDSSGAPVMIIIGLGPACPFCRRNRNKVDITLTPHFNMGELRTLKSCHQTQPPHAKLRVFPRRLYQLSLGAQTNTFTNVSNFKHCSGYLYMRSAANRDVTVLNRIAEH